MLSLRRQPHPNDPIHPSLSPPLPSRAAPGDPILESVRWVAPRAILASLLATRPPEDDGDGGADGADACEEEEDVIHMAVTWERWGGGVGEAPEGLAATELGMYYMGVSAI